MTKIIILKIFKKTINLKDIIILLSIAIKIKHFHNIIICGITRVDGWGYQENVHKYFF